MKIKSFKYILSVGLLLFSMVSFAAASSPVDMLQQVSNEMLTALKNPQNRNTQALYKLVETKLVPHVDLNRMSQLVLGPYWVQASPKERDEFQHQLTQYVTRMYSQGLSSYTNEKVRFFPMRGEITSNRVQVNGSIEQSNGQGIPVSYKLIKKNGEWLVYDFSVEGRSMVVSCRSQFTPILRKQGLSGLNEYMKSK